MKFDAHEAIPGDWKVVNLGNILLSSDYGVSEQTNNVKVGYPVLRMGNMLDGKIIEKELVYLDMDDETFQKYKLSKGDLLFNRTNSYEHIGKVSIFNLEGDYTFSSYIVRLKVDTKKAIPEYVNYYMNTNESKNIIKRLSTKGVQQVNVNPTILKKMFYIRIPNSIKEQEKIVHIISKWDKAIELKEKLIELKREKKKGLMQKLLTGKVRLPGFTGEWKEVKLGSILKERKETGFEDLELLAITSEKGVVRRTEVDKKDTSSKDKSKYKRILPYDIGYNTMRMWQGVSGVSKYEGIVSPAYTVLKPTEGISSYFIGYLFKLPKVINLFKRYSQGLVKDTLNLKYENLKDIRVFIPTDFYEQKSIADVLLCIDKLINTLQKEVSSLKEQKKGLMQLLMTGKVRVKV